MSVYLSIGAVSKQASTNEIQINKNLNLSNKKLKFSDYDAMKQFSITEEEKNSIIMEEKVKRIREEAFLSETKENFLSPKISSDKKLKLSDRPVEIHAGLNIGQNILMPPTPQKKNPNRQLIMSNRSQQVNMFGISNETPLAVDLQSDLNKVQRPLMPPTPQKKNPNRQLITSNRFQQVNKFGISNETPLAVDLQSSLMNVQRPLMPPTPQKKNPNRQLIMSNRSQPVNQFGISNETPLAVDLQSNLNNVQSPMMPPTPQKKNLKRQFPISNEVQQLKNITISNSLSLGNRVNLTPSQLCQAIEQGIFKIEGVKVLTKLFSTGTFLKACTITSENPEHLFVKEVDNTEVIFKYFLEYHAKIEANVKKYMTNSIANYKQIVELGLPCSKIFNIDTAIEDKYYLVEMIPQAVDFTNENHVSQIVEFIKVCSENKVAGDFSYSNFRVTLDGKVKSIDFDEEGVKFDYSNEHRIFTIQFLKSWANKIRETLYKVDGKPVASQLLTEFNKSLGFEASLVDGIIDDYFKIYAFESM
ncbi:MAG: hypothetical protein H0U49_05315 [Parachlamydiaceae bacterium]|nr:hypothetical protein [Parachlamydiaceae bacterium]